MVLWQSFDYPGDTWMPEMKIGWNLETGQERYLSSWKSANDPAEGEYALKLDLRGLPQMIIFKGHDIYKRLGSWNGVSLVADPVQDFETSPKFVANGKEVYNYYQVHDSSVFFVYTLTPSGTGQSSSWTTQTSTRNFVSTGEHDQCENYAFCGTNSICNYDGNRPTCECLRSYVPKSPDQWKISIWRNGCVPRNKSTCNNSYTDGFFKYTNLKLPDTSSSWFNITINLDECRELCLKNCSCTAYANLDIRDGGRGCLLWFNTLVDMRKFSQWGQDLYVRVPASELGLTLIFPCFIRSVKGMILLTTAQKIICNASYLLCGIYFSNKIQCFFPLLSLEKLDSLSQLLSIELFILKLVTDRSIFLLDHAGHGNNKKKIVGIIVGVTSFGLIATCLCIFIIKNPGAARKFYNQHYKSILRMEDSDLPTFNLSVIAKATGNFSTENKVGEGGFGPVHKGTLIDGKEIAVKRLSKNSGQGLYEFKNEVALIAKLQHRNLVKLLDETKRKFLDWSKRFNIISGIARGLLYLHQDSTLRIIHRDLKTSNILLDANLDPKISDFGLARLLLGDQVEANTTRVAGTYGYIPPEYASRGHFSVKSDVFSYGVIVLEIVSGKKNREFLNLEHDNNLLGHAWRFWTEEKALELLDEVLTEQCTPSEVIRCIQIGLLCVQQRPEDRPDMSSVVLMLKCDQSLPKPKVPGFYTEIDITTGASPSSTNHRPYSINELSITMLEAR
uniref:Receptor-like serine/threonine-protein kinase n=1 Tax=Cajanus cajan TaxID=3821 RepID=A0A151UH94_CAJCA